MIAYVYCISSYEGVVDMKKIVHHTENSPNLVRSIAFKRR